MIIADTDVLVDFLAGRGPAREPVAVAIEQGNLCTTAITRFELLCGARNPRQENTILTLLAALPTLPLDEGASARQRASVGNSTAPAKPSEWRTV